LKSKTLLLLLFTLCFSQISFGQIGQLKIKKSDNSLLIGENRDNYLSIIIYTIDNPSGSSGFEEGHEISYNLLVAVSEFDEEPNQNLFDIGDFYNPKFIKWTKIKE